MSEAAEEVGESSGGGPVTLLAHSAGGWLARVYLLAKGTQTVDRLVTLGSPHQPPPTVTHFSGLSMTISFSISFTPIPKEFH